MTLDELRALLAVLEAGSINQAAARLGVPRTTLARRIESLEAGFGTSLITLSQDGAAPTMAGQRLAMGAGALIRQAAELDAEVRLGLEAPSRPVRVSVSVGLHPTMVAMGLEHVRQRLPQVQLQLRAEAEPLHHAPEDRPDFILGFGRPLKGDYRVFQLVRLPFALHASPRWLAEHGAPATAEALCAAPLWAWQGALVATEEGSAVRLSDGRLLPVRPAVVLNDVHQLHVAVQRDLCLALLPCSPFDAYEPDEVEVLPGALGGSTGLWLAAPERTVELPWARRLITEARQIFAAFDDPGGEVQGAAR